MSFSDGVEYGDMTWRERQALVQRQRAKGKHGGVRECPFPGCAHPVSAHAEKNEDPERKCTIPGCPCQGLAKS